MKVPIRPSQSSNIFGNLLIFHIMKIRTIEWPIRSEPRMRVSMLDPIAFLVVEVMPVITSMVRSVE